MLWTDMAGGENYADDPLPERDLPRPDIDYYHGGPIVSARALRVLQPLIDGHAQALPVWFPTGEEYFMLHVMTFLDGVFDPVASEAKFFPGDPPTRVMLVKEHVFWPLPPGEEWPPIFRIGEDQRAPRFVNEAFRQTVLSAGLIGAEFKPIRVHSHPKPR